MITLSGLTKASNYSPVPALCQLLEALADPMTEFVVDKRAAAAAKVGA